MDSRFGCTWGFNRMTAGCGSYRPSFSRGSKNTCADRPTGSITRWSLPFVLALALFAVWSCGPTTPAQPVSGEEAARIKAELQDRSFRQFEPSKDASPRKGVIFDFFGPVSIWAQYAEGGRALNEWEMVSDDYRIERHGDSSEITIYLDQPRSMQTLPTKCDDCVPTAGVSISIRDVFDSAKISFKLNDPNGVLPPPFPVFRSWTRFIEDEIME